MRTKVWVTCTLIKRWFGIQPETLKSKKVTSRQSQDGSSVEYDMDDVVEKCRELIGRKFHEPVLGSERTAKDRLEMAKALSAELDLSKKQGRLAEVDKIQSGYESGLAGLKDSILEIPHLMRKMRPNIEPALLDLVNTAIARGLNEAAKAHTRSKHVR